MLVIKNDQILLYFHLHKIVIILIKGPGTSFQSPVVNQKRVRNVSHTSHQYFDSAQDSKEIKCNFHYLAMLMMASQILRSVHFTKTQKSRCFENRTLFFLEKNKLFIAYQGLLYCKKVKVAKVTFESRDFNILM